MVSPVLFEREDQRPSANASDMVSFGTVEEELLDDSMSLISSDTEDMSALLLTTPPALSTEPSNSKPWMDVELFRILSKAVEELGLKWSMPEEPTRSRLDEWFLPGRRQAPHQRASSFFGGRSTKSLRSNGRSE